MDGFPLLASTVSLGKSFSHLLLSFGGAYRGLDIVATTLAAMDFPPDMIARAIAATGGTTVDAAIDWILAASAGGGGDGGSVEPRETQAVGNVIATAEEGEVPVDGSGGGEQVDDHGLNGCPPEILLKYSLGDCVLMVFDLFIFFFMSDGEQLGLCSAY